MKELSNLDLDNMSISKAQSLGNEKVNEILKLNNITTANGEEPEAVNNTLTAASSIVKKYGIIQDIIVKAKKEDPLLKAKRILNENCKPKEFIEVECIGDINYRVGFGVHLVVPFLKGYEDCFMYIKDVEHEWKSDSLFISKLTLTPSRVMDEVEWTDIDDEEDADDSIGGGELWNKIYALLRQQEGKLYVWGATGPDSFDCSGLVQYCYNQFSDELGITLGRTTYDQCKQGTEVDKDNKAAWNPGDLLFWNGSDTPPSHVSIYIGGDKMMHAPKTGDVVKTVDVTRTDIYTVRRVIKDIITANINDDSIPSEYESYLSSVESNCSTFIANMKKYGYKSIIASKSNVAGIDPYITAAIIAIESEGNPYCGDSYYGLMQVSGGSSDPATNIEQGLKEYKIKMSYVGIQVHVILSAYNSGEGTVAQACKQNGYSMSTVTIKQLGDALYEYVKNNQSSWDPNEKKYYSSKVLKAYNVLKSKKVLG